jgi:hypothetical protein
MENAFEIKLSAALVSSSSCSQKVRILQFHAAVFTRAFSGYFSNGVARLLSEVPATGINFTFTLLCTTIHFSVFSKSLVLRPLAV